MVSNAKKAVNATLEVYKRPLSLRNQRWRWKLLVNGNNVANGSEGYSDRAEALEMGTKVTTGAYNVDTGE